MGIDGLNKALSELKDENIFVKIHHKCFRGCSVAIDANNYFNRIQSIVVEKNSECLNLKTGIYNPTVIRRELVFETLSFIKGWYDRGVKPIFVFDGEAPEMKLGTQLKRVSSKISYQEKRDKLLERINKGLIMSSTIESELRKYCKYSVSFNRSSAAEVSLLLRDIGVPCLRATKEAEKLCCMLARQKYVTLVYSNDTDCLLYDGCNYVITDIRYPHYYCTQRREILRSTNLSIEQFKILCIVMGCDYNEGSTVFSKALKIAQNADPESEATKIGKDNDKLKIKLCLKEFETEKVSTLTDKTFSSQISVVVPDRNTFDSVGLSNSYDGYIKILNIFLLETN